VAYFWPNMLGVVAEKVPLTGALGLAIMGGIGHLGGAIAQPVMGKVHDIEMIRLGDPLAAGAATLQYVIILAGILTLSFLFLLVRFNRSGRMAASR
jgi:hypothetical protein